LLWLVVWLWAVSDHPREAAWISAQERTYIETALEAEDRAAHSAGMQRLWTVMSRPSIWVLVGIAFLLYAGNYGCLFWLPTVLREFGRPSLSNFEIGTWNSVPYLIATLAMAIVAHRSDRFLERRAYVGISTAWGGAALLADARIIYGKSNDRTRTSRL
jgi:sugar phosphate permease